MRRRTSISARSKRQLRKEQKQAAHYSSSEDDERWETEEEPMINIFSFGWTEDGRLGYQREDGATIQLCPCPIVKLQPPKPTKSNPHPKQYVCKRVSAGSRHTLFLMIDSSKNLNKKVIKEDDSDVDSEEEEIPVPKRHRKLLISGLNHVGLCEEPGYDEPMEVPWDESFDRPVDVCAGRGVSFVITKLGHVYSWGFGKFGILGHGDSLTLSMPRRILSLERVIVKKVSAGAYHAVAMTDENSLFSWGRNHKGQLGIGYESPEETLPKLIEFPPNLKRSQILDIACGFEHSIALRLVASASSVEDTLVFGWGDESRGQLGSGDREQRFRPQENRYVTKFLKKHSISIVRVVAGGFHNLALVAVSGQVFSWGGNDYGQLGQGNQFDNPEPKFIRSLDKVTDLSAGLRHSAAICESRTIDVMTWGFNGFGELGLGDTDIRLQPSRVSAIKNSKITQVACGDRHTLLISSHKPLHARDLPVLRPYFRILQEEGRTRQILKKLKVNLAKEGLEPSLIDDPSNLLPHQAGYSSKEMKNDAFEKGLRYCLDTYMEKYDWRRNAMEACFECFMPNNKHLKKVCLSCARNCLSSYRLRPYIRSRNKGDTCDCRELSGICVSKWSPIRHAFDSLACVDDKCIGPNQVRQLLKKLRTPFPVESADIDDCLSVLADGIGEDEELPRIKPVPFEKWYRKYYDEPEAADATANVEEVKGLEDV